MSEPLRQTDEEREEAELKAIARRRGNSQTYLRHAIWDLIEYSEIRGRELEMLLDVTEANCRVQGWIDR